MVVSFYPQVYPQVMWPFFRAKRVDPEWDEHLAEILRRLKTLEREHDDLHAAYRRIRATTARAAVQMPANGEEVPSAIPAAGALSAKDELRRRHLGKGRVATPGSDLS